MLYMFACVKEVKHMSIISDITINTMATAPFVPFLLFMLVLVRFNNISDLGVLPGRSVLQCVAWGVW
jgi:hypothetical protein